MLLVEGTIIFDGDGEPPAGATVYVRLEDVSRADAPATVVAEQVIREAHPGAQAGGLAFTLHGSPLDPRRRYGVRVHVDVDGDGAVGAGDYVSTTSYAVRADRVPVRLSVAVRRIF
jgi:uncharacterized lipoprotein YbaY